MASVEGRCSSWCCFLTKNDSTEIKKGHFVQKYLADKNEIEK